MKRIDRARFVRDLILQVPSDEWSWVQVGDQKFREVSRNGWKASCVTPFTPFERGPRTASNYQRAQILQNLKRPMPYMMDVWLVGGGKVLSIEWDGEDMNLISMKRGAWEAEQFGLPPWSPKP